MLDNGLILGFPKRRNKFEELNQLLTASWNSNLPDDVKNPHALDGHKGFKRLKQKEVIERFNVKHGEKYTYQYVKYKNSITPIRVFCSEHGDFYITPRSHWNGVGCPDCKSKPKLEKKKKVSKTRGKQGCIDMTINPLLLEMSTKGLDDAQIHEYLHQHYDAIETLIKGVANDQFHLIINGEAGTGKTEFVKSVLKKMGTKRPNFLSGTISGIALFCELQKFQQQGQITVIDDTDMVLKDPVLIDLLKAALDTQPGKLVNWSKMTNALKKDNLDTFFEFKGRVIIITNIDLSTNQKNKTLARQAIDPVISRCHPVPASLPNAKWQMEAIKMFYNNYKNHSRYQLRCFEESSLKPEVLNEIIEWMDKHKHKLIEISFRAVAKLVQLAEMMHKEGNPDGWKFLAEMTSLRQYQETTVGFKTTSE